MKLCSIEGCGDAKRLKRGLCDKHYAQWLKSTPKEDRESRDARRGCVVTDCEFEGRSFGRGMCAKHYYRQLRHGSPDRLLIGTRYERVMSGGYLERKAPSHPLARRGWVLSHRAVLYDAIGPSAHPCHWCGMELRWEATYQVDRHALVVDHLDWDRQHNEPSNLVPSCLACNVKRVNPLVRRRA